MHKQLANRDAQLVDLLSVYSFEDIFLLISKQIIGQFVLVIINSVHALFHQQVASGITPRRPEYKKEYKKLGFKNDINPAQDFKDTPPGMLALDNMIYFARNHTDQ